MDQEVAEALEALEFEYKIAPPGGALPLPPRIRFSVIIGILKIKICPHAAAIQAKVDSRPAEAITVIADAIGSYVTSSPFVVTTLARSLASVGLKKFCETPTLLLS